MKGEGLLYNYTNMLDLEQIEQAIKLMSVEKKIPRETLIEIIEAALRTAYKKDYGHRDEEVNVTLNFEDGTIDIEVEKTIVEEVENSYMEISLEEVGGAESGFSIGDVVEIDVTDEVMKDGWESFGRIASQAARQVIIQKLGDSEKQRIYDLFKDKQGEVINMKVEIVEGGKIIFDYNGNQVILPKSEQVSRDEYKAGARFFIYVAEVDQPEGGAPKVVLSRKRPELVSGIFGEHVPEIEEGLINIDRIVRQPGVKTKMIVSTNYDEIDPVGTLIGQKGIRVKAVMDELSGEKIDIIPAYENVEDVIKKSLSPAEVLRVEIDEDQASAKVFIIPSERPKAVGKWGINVNLASKLTGYRISIEDVEVEPSQQVSDEDDENEL